MRLVEEKWEWKIIKWRKKVKIKMIYLCIKIQINLHNIR